MLVWYSPDALYFGIVARDRDPSTVRATLAERDDIDRGVVTEVQPVATSAANGQRSPAGDLFQRGSVELDPSVNAGFGLPNLAIDTTINPDFSQVESDAGLVTTNEHTAADFATHEKILAARRAAKSAAKK